MKTKADSLCANYSFEFHPDLNTILMKITKHLYSKETRPFNLYDANKANDVADYLAHALQIKKVKKETSQFIGSLSKPMKLSLVRMIFLDPTFEKLKKDNWNYYNDYVRDWPKQLADTLAFSDIRWDRKKRSLVCGKNRATITLPARSKFVKMKNKDHFYNVLTGEVNKAYASDMPNAVFVLSRKLIENLLIDLLRLKFKTDTNIYYDKSRKRFQDLSVLISNLSKRKSLFVVDERDIEKIVPRLNKLREKSNATAHSITEITKMDEINDYDIPELIVILERLKDNIGDKK